MNIYTMIFATSFDRDDFVATSQRIKLVKLVRLVDNRTIDVVFRKGTKASRILSLCDLWNAEIYSNI